jgi:branched-chain amino acid transport system substrate-binding protein
VIPILGPVIRCRTALLLTALVVGACAPAAPPAGILVVGLMLPLTGPSASLANEELNGIQIAVDDVNHAGGAGGKQIKLMTRDVTSREATSGVVDQLKRAGAIVVMGAYDSSLSIPAAHAASAAGMVYWETGSVADQVTGEGLPHVFRIGPAGSNLGTGSAVFAAAQLAPRLGKPAGQLRVSVVQVDDAYGQSVAAAAMSKAQQLGFAVAGPVTYVAWHPDWTRVFSSVTATQPDILVLASHVPDGIAFRREMLARGVRVKALIGSTMAECGPDFGRALGVDAVGIFASDRPTSGFNPSALDGSGLAAYRSLVATYRERFHRDPGEEAISGFSSAWALGRYTLPRARTFDTTGISEAAMAQDLPAGSLPNGSGLKFSRRHSDLGQNLRSSSVIWQWQGVRKSVTVWPALFATGQIEMVPLPR